MKLESELRQCGCGDNPVQFRKRLILRLKREFPGHTIDDLLCAPLESLEFCNGIRGEIGIEHVYDAVILKTLLNIRKSKQCPRELKPKGKSSRLATALRQCGYSNTTEFRELFLTIDNLLCHPREALALCSVVRRQTGACELSDEDNGQR